MVGSLYAGELLDLVLTGNVAGSQMARMEALRRLWLSRRERLLARSRGAGSNGTTERNEQI